MKSLVFLLILGLSFNSFSQDAELEEVKNEACGKLKKAADQQIKDGGNANKKYSECISQLHGIKDYLDADSKITVDDVDSATEISLMAIDIYDSELLADVIKGGLELEGVVPYTASTDGMFVIDLEKIKENAKLYEKEVSQGSKTYVKKDAYHYKKEITPITREGGVIPADFARPLTSIILQTKCTQAEEVSTCKDRVKALLEEEDFKREVGAIAITMIGDEFAKRRFEQYLVEVKGHNGDRKWVEGSGDNHFQGLHKNSNCLRPSRYTADFFACKNIITMQTASMVGEGFKNVGNQVAGQLQQVSIRNEVRDAVANGEDNGSAALKAQESAYKGQKNRAIAAGAVYAGAAGTLSGSLATYPSPAQLSRKCAEYSGEGRTAADTSSHPYYCYMAKNMNGFLNEQVFKNQNIKKLAWYDVGRHGGNALVEALKAIHFNDLQKQVTGVKNSYNDALEELDDLTVAFDGCEGTPELCNTNTGDAQVSSFQMGNFNFGTGSAQNLAFDDDNVGETDDDNGLSRTRAKSLKNRLNPSSKKSDGSFRKVAGGKLRQASRGGGGAGGGGAGGGGGGGGGGSDPSASTASAGPTGSYGVKKASWSRGGGYKRGKGSSRKTAKKPANPYGGLFKKGPSRGIASKANDIAPKASGLFDKISKRYGKLSASDRLKKY